KEGWRAADRLWPPPRIQIRVGRRHPHRLGADDHDAPRRDERAVGAGRLCRRGRVRLHRRRGDAPTDTVLRTACVICDLRSALLGRVSAEVLRAFEAAASRTPGFGRDDDRDERALAEEASDLFGFSDALFVPTGTMANQIAVRLWLRPGETLIADRWAHV